MSMAERVIQTADLLAIESNLRAIHNSLQVVNDNVATVDQHVDGLENELNELREAFDEFVNQQMLANRRQVAETRLVQIRQELDKRYGHYDVIRRTATGILQATDLGLIRQQIIRDATEEMMISAPGYWLAPCLVALAAWICDKRELAEKALKEAIQRDDEKTSLFFSLICRRAARKLACVKWVSRYLMVQDEENLDRKTILVLTAYANGLWGNDTEGRIMRQIDDWLEHLKNKPGFVEKQTQQWHDAIVLKRPAVSDKLAYPYLKKYSPTWPKLEDVMQGAYLHGELDQYFTNIFAQEGADHKLVQELDDVLNTLVTDFDDEELPLRRKEELEQQVLECNGDEALAKKHMEVRQTALETHKDFIQLLTDAAMNPELAHADIATQKFAISLSRDWIQNAYNDVVAENRSKVPHEIEIAIDDFSSKTSDGSNEEALFSEYDTYVNTAQTQIMEGKTLTSFDNACKILRFVFVAVAAMAFFGGTYLGGFLCLIVAFLFHKRYKKRLSAYQQAIAAVQQLEERRKNGKEILRALMAETIDFREEFAEKDAESQKVTDFLQELNPNQFVKQRLDSARHVLIQEG